MGADTAELWEEGTIVCESHKINTVRRNRDGRK